MTSTEIATTIAQSQTQDGTASPLALHQDWLMKGWERNAGDPAFVFVDRMGKYYDLNDPTGVFWDNFAPGGTQLFSSAMVYGPNWEGLQNASKSILHGMTDGHTALVSGDVASTTIGFVGKIERLTGEVLAFDARSQMGWKCIDGVWKIKQELNYAWLVEPEAIESTLGKLLTL